MDRVDRLAQVASQLAARVRDDDPEANRRWLDAVCPDLADREALLYVLAAAVPVDVPWTHLTAWTRVTVDSPEVIAERRRVLNEALKGVRISPTSHRAVA